MKSTTEGEWLGSLVRYWREDLGLRQADVAAVMTEELGVPWSQSAVANIEKGRRTPGLLELMALCVVYGLTLNDFLFPEDRDAHPGDDFYAVTMPDGTHTINIYALTEVLADGLVASTAESWRFPGAIDPVRVLNVVEELRGDPEFRALKEMVRIKNDDRLRELISECYREDVGATEGRVVPKGEGTARELVDAWEEYLATQDKTKKYETPHAKRALRTHARAYAADQIIEKVMGEQ